MTSGIVLWLTDVRMSCLNASQGCLESTRSWPWLLIADAVRHLAVVAVMTCLVRWYVFGLGIVSIPLHESRPEAATKNTTSTSTRRNVL